uniref:Uncharacterized protein n=1 Tax=Rhizophora mucronata TaxID=61149 RepID=A0A2P2Q4W8_RHIMU
MNTAVFLFPLIPEGHRFDSVKIL